MSMRIIVIAVAAVALVAMGAIVLGSREAASERDPTEVRTVTVRNDCARAVWLFYGRNPPVRPQDALQLPPDASSAQPMLEGDVIWLLDDARTVLDDVAIGAATRTVVVGDSCRSFTATSTR